MNKCLKMSALYLRPSWKMEKVHTKFSKTFSFNKQTFRTYHAAMTKPIDRTVCKACRLPVLFRIQGNPARDFSFSRTNFQLQKESKPLDSFLKWAIYGSMILGTTLLSYIAYDVLKRRRLWKKGIVPVPTNETGGMRLFVTKNYTLPEMVSNSLYDIQAFETCEDDIWVISFPRSGKVYMYQTLNAIHMHFSLKLEKVILIFTKVFLSSCCIKIFVEEVSFQWL